MPDVVMEISGIDGKGLQVSEGRGVSVLELVKAEYNVLFSTDFSSSIRHKLTTMFERWYSRGHFLHARRETKSACLRHGLLLLCSR